MPEKRDRTVEMETTLNDRGEEILLVNNPEDLPFVRGTKAFDQLSYEPDRKMKPPRQLPTEASLPEDWVLFSFHILHDFLGLRQSIPTAWEFYVGEKEREIVTTTFLVANSRHKAYSAMCDAVPPELEDELVAFITRQIYICREDGTYAEPKIMRYEPPWKQLTKRLYVVSASSNKHHLSICEPLTFPIRVSQRDPLPGLVHQAEAVLRDYTTLEKPIDVPYKVVDGQEIPVYNHF